MYDAIVVGARAAGSPTAMLLARAGLNVLLVDRATFPSDTLSTHQLTLSAVARLQRWNLLDRLIAGGVPPIHRLTMKLGPLTIAGGFAPLDGLSTVYAPRRTVLDKLLVDAAVEAGAELREGYTVQGLLYDATGRVCGIRGRGADGASDEVRGRIVIGADGTRSQVARWVEAPAYNTKPSLSYGYYAYFSGVPMDNAAEVTIGAGEAVIASPTHGDETIVIVQGARDGFHAFREEIEGNFYRILALSPALNEQVRAGRRESRFFGTA
ncbi:MAG TPA: FAD-dependent monooxygenase, partial [Dehalococcoidia bacterium]